MSETNRPLPFYATSAFAILMGAIILVFFVTAAILALYLTHQPEAVTTPAIATIVGLAGPLIAVLVLLIRQQFNIAQIQDHMMTHQELQQTVQQVADDVSKGNGSTANSGQQ